VLLGARREPHDLVDLRRPSSELGEDESDPHCIAPQLSSWRRGGVDAAVPRVSNSLDLFVPASRRE
jgi:hypothetical protein